MNVLICGVDGYIGWPLALHLIDRGHKVIGIDNIWRRRIVESLTPIVRFETRAEMLKSIGSCIKRGDITDYNDLIYGFRQDIDAIVHLAEMPSAPYSMASRENAIFTHNNNINGTLNLLYFMKEKYPDAALIKLGTMGEWGTPNIDIPEGFLKIEHNGRTDTLPFPKQPNSWYHNTKSHDTTNIMFACKTWDIRATDIMQGVVYGTKTPETEKAEYLNTRFDYDESFGTIINRFCVQALIEHPLTLYGRGKQKRGFLPLKDSIQCLTLAIENPPKKGEYRVFNQFEEVYTLDELASRVLTVARRMGYNAKIQNLENPRTESDDHYYNPEHRKLLELGYKPTTNIESEMLSMMSHLEKYKDRINKEVIMPKVKWK